MSCLKYFVLIMYCFFLSACASVPELQKQLSENTQSATSFNEMVYTQIKANEEMSLTLGGKSKTYMFENGKGYYEALSIPEPGKPRKLKIKSYVSSQYLPAANILVPQLELLNSNKVPIGKIADFRLDPETDFWLGGYFVGEVNIPADVSYLVLHAANTSTQSLELNSANGKMWPMPLAPAGKLAMTLSDSLPADFDFSTVLIKDSANVYSDSKVDFFFVSNIDDKEVKNSSENTRLKNIGRGLSMKASVIDRAVPIKPCTLTIIGKTQYAAPIQAITNKVYQVKGKINFTPEKNKTYLVKGELTETYSAVWVEDEESHKIMDKKIEINGSAEQGLFSK